MTDESIFAAALAICSPADRAAFLDRACDGNPDLRREVNELLSAHAASNPLDLPPADLARTGAYEPQPNEAPPAAVGDRVGPYRLMEQIGEGGFGLVFVAEQTEPVRRKVALKVLKPGMDTRDVVARFEAERQALALMDHPNIARVLDAGSTPQGRPFFVMELVRGVPITEFCDAQKLPPRDRLALFAQVCRAVQHAHQKGVIHRDIKPTNVLVTTIDGAAVPKVIDFGVAKAVGQQLTEKTVYTRFAQMIGTPLYMSPEQAELSGVDVDTRADIYSLGVMLYELLTGTTPFDKARFRKAAFDEIRRIIREEEPPRPSTRLTSLGDTLTAVSANRGTDAGRLAGLVRGELDWIVMRALEKDRNRRYESAAGFAKDVERYLSGDAVEACPPTLGYRLRKFYRRNRAALLVAAAFGTLVSGAGVLAGVLAVKADRARDEAVHRQSIADAERQRAEDAEEVATRERGSAMDALGRLQTAQEQQAADQYVWDMRLLPLAFEASNVVEVNRVLDRHVPRPGTPDRRGFEWYYWDRQLHTDLRTDRLPDAGGGRVSGVWTPSPDGSRLARFTTSSGGAEAEEPPTLTVWDVASRRVVLKHRMPIEKPVNQDHSSGMRKAPVFSPDGKSVVVEWGFTTPAFPKGADGRHLRQVLDVATGKVILTLEGDLGQGMSGIGLRGRVEAAFSPDGRRLAAVCRELPKNAGFQVFRGQVRVWELETGKEVCGALDANGLADPPFNKDGTVLVTQNRQQQATRVAVWDLARGEERAGWVVPEAELVSLALSPDGARVAGATAHLFQRVVLKGTPPPPEPHVKVWDVSGKEVAQLSPSGSTARTTARRVFFSPDGSRVVVERSPDLPSAIGAAADVSFWDAATGKLLASPAGLELREAGFFHEIVPAFSPDGKQFVHVEGNVLRTWDVETGRPVLTLRGHLNPVAARAFSADGKRLWSVEFDGLLKEWDALPGRVEVGLAGAGRTSTVMSALAVSPDGSRVASLTDVKHDARLTAPWVTAVRIWDATGKPVGTFEPPPRATDGRRRPDYALALSRDGRRAVLTRHETGFPLGQGKDGIPPPDLTVWDVASNTVILHQPLEWGHAPRVAISPDGKAVAVASKATENRAAVRVFDLDGKRERARLSGGDAGGISSFAFSPDGRRLAAYCSSVDTVTGKQAASVVVWDVESGAKLCAVEVFGGRSLQAGITTSIRIAWAPDGSRFVFSPDPGRSARIAGYDLTGKQVLELEEPASAERTSGVQYVAYSPDGKRIAALQLGRTFSNLPALRVWDATTGKELLSLRPKNLETLGDKSLTFTGDGHRLQLAELLGDRRPPEAGGGVASVRSLVLTTWDAAPIPNREPKAP